MNNATAVSFFNDSRNAAAFAPSDNKRADGRYYTRGDPFSHAAFCEWARVAGLPQAKVLEPFAGANNLIKTLRAAGLCETFAAFDILPGDKSVKRRDTLADFPRGFNVCITNPPWLARNSATRRGLPYPQTRYDDLYKHCLAECLAHCGYVAALVPESFIRGGLFTPRLSAFVSLNNGMFADTEHPVGLALFVPRALNTILYCGATKIGELRRLREYCPPASRDGGGVSFNSPDGNLGLIALDNNFCASIRFCEAAELDGYEVRQSCRAITKIRVPGRPQIGAYNRFINSFRKNTMDVFLTAYRGLRKDGFYRRRLDYALARDIISYVGF